MSRRTLSVFVTVLLVASILLPIFTHPAYAAFDPWASEWNYRKLITINAGQVPATALTNFPVLIDTTLDKTKVRGDGYDILFMDGAGSANKLDHEIELYDSGTGHLVAWVRIPSLSKTVGGTFYIYYGNSGAANQQNPTGVWDSTFKMVQHMKNGADTSHISDSTSYGNNGTKFAVGTGAAQPNEVDGRFGKAQNFVRVPTASGGYITFANPSGNLNFGTGSFSYMLWFKRGETGITTTQNIINKKPGSMGLAGPGYVSGISSASKFFSSTVADSSSYQRIDTNATAPGYDVANWEMFTVVVDRSQTLMFVYMNSTSPYSKSINFGNVNQTSYLLRLGGSVDGTNNGAFFQGVLDEVRFQNVALSAGWISTSYNSMNSPSTFYGMATEEQKPATTHTITASVSGGHGTISPSGAVSVNHGADQAFTMDADLGYHLSGLLVDGGSVTPVSPYTFPAVTIDHTIVASFSIDTGVVVTLNAVLPQYYMRGSTVSYSGTVSPAGPGTTVGILVTDRNGVKIYGNDLTPTGGAFSDSFLIGLTGAEGVCTIYASSGDGHAQTSFYLDISAPTSSVSTPAQGSTVTSMPVISGSASDPNLADGNLGSGVSSVAVTIQQVTGGLYWTGTTWGSLTFLAASYSAGSWNYAGASGVSWTTGSYTVVSNATDVAGNVQAPGVGNTFYLDMTEYTLSVSSSPAEGGSVTKNPNDPHYHYGDSVVLTANPADHWSFSAWSGAISGTVSPRTIIINGTTTITATFTQAAPTVTVIGAYHGARVSWNNVGALSYNIYYSTGNDPAGATQYHTGITVLTYDVTGLPSGTWDKTCNYWVAPVGPSGEAPTSSWGLGSGKVWVYKIEITGVTVTSSVPGYMETEIHFQSRYLEGPVTVQLEIGEYLGPGTVGSIPNRPIAISAIGPSAPFDFMQSGQFTFGSGNTEFVAGSSYKGWIFLWNRLPSDPGYWEAYAAKEEIIITIPM